MKQKVIVIGGGPAGAFAAIAAAENGAEVILLEKNEKLFSKLLLTGNGRCNVTNATEHQLFLEYIRTNEPFFRSSFYQFSNQDLMDFFEKENVPLKTEENHRVFPQTDDAHTIANALLRAMQQKGVTIKTKQEVTGLLLEDTNVLFVQTNNSEHTPCHHVILATGGKSFQQTGSNGQGYLMAEKLGHSIVPLKPSLASIHLKDNYTKACAGISVSHVNVQVLLDDKKKFETTGSILFTHKGLSGPCILTASAYIDDAEKANYTLQLDFYPNQTFEELDKKLVHYFSQHANKALYNVLFPELPKALLKTLLLRAEIDPTIACHQVTKAIRHQLILLVKKLSLPVLKVGGFDEAMITRGGVNVKEVNPKTMQSKQMPNLYFAGEILDIDALTGGFNLQIAFSTGYAAGSHAARAK